MTKRKTHKQAVVSAIAIGRVYRDKQFVFKEGDMWVSIPAKGRDAIRRVNKHWPR